MIGPVLFVSIFVIEGRLRVGYDSRAMYVSALSLGPRGWVQILNFVVFGLLLLAFARGVAAGAPSRVGPALLTIIAFGYLLSGPFVMDPVGTSRSLMSIHGTVHGILGGIVFLLMPVSCFVFVHRFRRDPKWRSLQWCTLAAGTTIAIAVAILTIATKVVSAQNAFDPWLGLIQRAAIVPYMVWLFIFALTLRRKCGRMTSREFKFTTEINGCPQTVFDLVADMPNYGRWLPDSSAFGGTVNVTPYPVQLGTTYLDAGPIEKPGVVTEFDPPKHISFHHTVQLRRGFLNTDVDARVRYAFESKDGRTFVERKLFLAFDLHGFYRLMLPLLLYGFRKENDRTLAALKKYVEVQTASPRG
jgi:uncharacterized protein YndB with AHSA1/START domain